MNEKNNVFPVGFWNYTHSNVVEIKSAVADWQQLGMTVAMSSEYEKSEDKQYILDTLDQAQKRGIKVIVCDYRTHWNYYGAHGEKEFTRAVKEAIEDFGHHEAFLAFHIGDEPVPKTKVWEDMKHAAKIVNSLSRGFVNFFPLFGFKDNGMESEEQVMDMLADTAKETGLFCLCYDCYTQCNYEIQKEKGLEEYFKNLVLFKKAADRVGIPFWTTLLSVGHCCYRTPDRDDIRWQIYTALAHGVQGILWFFIYERDKDSSFRESPINTFWEKTPMFALLSDENRMFLKYYSGKFVGSKLLNVFHRGKVYGGVAEYKDGVIVNFTVNDGGFGPSLIISEFEKNGKKFVCVTNQDQKMIEIVSGEYNGRKYSEWLAPGQLVIIE